jgi:hypothetical protein
MADIYARSLRRRQPGQGACGCCFMYGLGLLSIPLAVGLAMVRAARARKTRSIT